MIQRDTSQSEPDRVGQQWKEEDIVKDFIQRTDSVEGMRNEVFGLLAHLAPFAPDATIQVLDLGSGAGALASAILDAYPLAEATGLDMSEEMTKVGHERMGRFGDRFHYHVGDFSSGEIPADLPGSVTALGRPTDADTER